ncbi:MAG: hypothetical protein PVSMB4_17940 [Ktedonobacterales bacterium]
MATDELGTLLDRIGGHRARRHDHHWRACGPSSDPVVVAVDAAALPPPRALPATRLRVGAPR